MLPLYDMLMKGQDGRLADLLARQANLTRQQGELALEAVLPAFSEALKRNAADPAGIWRLLAAMGGGAYAKYFEDMARAFNPDGIAAGNQALGQLFGSKDLSRAVAEQAARATGIAEQAFRQMLPALAATMMGGFARQMSSQMAGEGDNPMMDFYRKAMEMGDAPQEADPFANPYARMMRAMLSPEGAEAARAPGQDFAGHPFFKMFEAMSGAPKASAQEAPGPDAYQAFFGEMFETGLRQQAAYEHSMRTLVDDLWKGTAPRKGAET